MHLSRKSSAHAVLILVLVLIASVTPAQATFTIFGPFPTITATYGVGTIPIVPPTTNSPAPWVFTSSNPKVARVVGGALEIVGTGYSTITASQSAIGAFTARSRSTQLRVSQGTPTLGNFPSQSIPITQRSFTIVPPTSTSDGIWTFTSSNPAIASVSGRTVTFHQGGFVVIYGVQGGTPNWKIVGTSMRLTVATLTPSLGSFGDITIMKDSVANINLMPPKSTSSGPWTFTSSNPAVASIIGNSVTPLAFGTTLITATQAAIGDFGSASATMTLTVQGPLPTLGSFPNVTVPLSTSSTFTVTPPTSTSTGTWSLTSSDTSVATINGSVATLLKPGSTTITATQSPSSLYGSPPPSTMTLTVVGSPTIGPWPDIQKVVNDPDFQLTPPTSPSDGVWSFKSSDPSVIEINGGVAKVKSAGKATITATQAATNFWTEGTATSFVQVFGHIPTLGAFAPIAANVGDAPMKITPPTSNSSGAWKFTSSNLAVAAVDGNTLVIVGPGTATITATQKSSGEFSQSNTVQTTLTVKPRPTPNPTPSAKPTPTPTVKPTPKAKPTSTAKAKPVVKPTATKHPVNQTIRVTAKGRVLTVVAIGVKALVFINGKPAKVGRNLVKPGIASIVITIADKVVYRRVFTIK